jgi:hypothetical protein
MGVVLLVAVLLTGCTTVVQGSARPGQPVARAPSSPEESGRVLEAHRLAAVTALVPDTFPDRTDVCSPAGPFASATALEDAYFPYRTVAGILEDAGFVAAWAQCDTVAGSSPATTVPMVIELADPAAAAQAVQRLGDSLAVDGFAPARVPGVEDPALMLTEDGADLVYAFVPVGRMVAGGYHTTTAGHGLDEAGRLMADEVDLIRPFRPTPATELAALPADPQGVADLVVDLPGEGEAVTGPYDLDGYLRLTTDPSGERAVLAENGLAGVYVERSSDGDRSFLVVLYVLSDPARTAAVRDALVPLESAARGGTAFVLPAVPDAPCFSFPPGESATARCFVTGGAHLASLTVGGPASPGVLDDLSRLLPDQRDLLAG